MEDMSSAAVSVRLSLGNPVCENSGMATHVEITRLKLVTDAASLLSDTAKVMSSDSPRSDDTKGDAHMVTVLASAQCGGAADLSKVSPKDGNRLTAAGDAMTHENEEDEILSVVEDSNGIINEGLLVLNAGSEISLPNSVEIESGRILAKAIILGESSIEQVPTTEVLLTAVNSDAKIPDGPGLEASEVVIKLPSEKNLTKGSRSVFELDCIPLWGSVSICGNRREMEDAIAAEPRYMKIPIKMLIGDRVIYGMSQSLTHLTGHFFGVYDGHGGSQV